MQEFLLEKITRISDEEKRIREGREIDRELYSGMGDFVINSEKFTGERDISVRTHTRFIDFPEHKHNYLEMMIVLSGKITHRIGEDEITLREGDILILNKHISHSIAKAQINDIGVNIIISDGFLDNMAEELRGTVFSELVNENGKRAGAGIYLAFSGADNRQIGNIIENMLFELTEYSSDIQILRRTVSLLFLYLSLKSEKLLSRASRLPDRADERKNAILSYVRNNYRTATLCELGRQVYLSAPYLSKLIYEYFGKGFKELLLEERIRRAVELLTNTDVPIGEIIHRVGYENESYFHKEFKARCGVTPLAMRKNGAGISS